MIFETSLRRIVRVCMLGLAGVAAIAGLAAAQEKPAKELFGGVTLPTRAAPTPYGFYAKGCMAGAVAIPADGPAWQAMRLSRNRRWGQPQMISLIEQFSREARKLGWPGLLLGDISQPRGGPMISGHSSHQIGLDADIWLTPMPDRRLSATERETMPFTSMLQKDRFLTVDPTRWTPTHAKLIMQAASYQQVERVFVNPAIKQKLCETWKGDRSDLGKVRPIYGHDSHFHIRLKCPPGAEGCKPQAAVGAGDGCDRSLAWWFSKEPWAAPKKDPDAKPVKPRVTTLSDLPKACTAVLAAAPVTSETQATYGGAPFPPANGDAPAVTVQDGIEAIINSPSDGEGSDSVPVPLIRPSLN